uniref:Uncharacterized protein n=1 Tax=Timema genevievae TaxID=629358 RepID=A0A7R9K1H3_TIMGE|nr:unnamed protein product [Timema genevievae]
MAMVASNMSGHIQSRLTRSLERILEEAHLSGELKLTGRKLKDFPKSGGKYDLGDTVFAERLELGNPLTVPPNPIVAARAVLISTYLPPGILIV